MSGKRALNLRAVCSKRSEYTTKDEAVEFIINAFKNDPSISEFSYAQGTVEGNTAPETTVSDNSIAESTEADYSQVVEADNKTVAQLLRDNAQKMYDDGIITKEQYESAMKSADEQEKAADNNKNQSTAHIDAPPPSGGTPDDPSTYGSAGFDFSEDHGYEMGYGR